MRCKLQVEAILFLALMLSTVIRKSDATPAGASLLKATDFTVVLSANASSAIVGEAIQLSATVTPYGDGQQVRIYLMVGQNWQELVSARIVNGSFTYSFKAQSRGIYELKAAVFSGSTVRQSEEIIVRFFAGGIFSRLLIEDGNTGELVKLRSFKESLRKGLVADKGVYSAFVVVNSALGSIVESPLWPSLRWVLYPELWLLITSRDVFLTFGSSVASLVFHSLLFGLVYLTGPVFLIGYYSRIGLTPIRWKKILGIPALILVLSLVVLAVSPFPELGCAAALVAFVNASLLPSVFMAKVLNL